MIKTTIVSEKEAEKPFPKIMRSTYNGVLVLFTDTGEGTVLHVDDALCPGSDYLGKASESWAMHNFEDWSGAIKLTQD